MGYIGDLGVSWCTMHLGVCNEDSDRCDAYDWATGDEYLDDDGDYLPCELVELFIKDPTA